MPTITLSIFRARTLVMQAFAEIGLDPVHQQVTNAARMLQETVGPDIEFIGDNDLKLLALGSCRLAARNVSPKRWGSQVLDTLKEEAFK